MKSKIKYIVILVVVGIVLLIISRSCSKKFENRIREDKKNTQKIENEYSKDWGTSIYNLFKGNYKIEEFPLSKKFLKKYKTLSDIIPGEIRFIFGKDADTFDIVDDIEKQIFTLTFKTGNGFEEIAYQLHYIINDKNELDDIEILDSKVIEDENGSYIQYDKYHYYMDCDFSYGLLVRPLVNRPNYLYVTENFLKKYPNYPNEGVLKDYKYMIEEDLYFDRDDKNVCWALVMDLENTTLFKIEVKLDDKGYVDDAIVTVDNVKQTEDPQYVQTVYDEYYS